jgi:hypothetical protein
MLTGRYEAISNQATWDDYGVVSDIETGDLIDLSYLDEITLLIRDPADKCVKISASLTGGQITIPGIGIYAWALDITSLCGGRSYEAAARVTIGAEIIQLFLIDLPVLDGIRA